MANYTVDPNMSFQNPIPGEETGPNYANEISAALTKIGAHGHTGAPNDGVNIVSAAININADLPFNQNNINSARSIRFLSQSSTLSGSGDVDNVYVVNGDLWYNNGSGTAIKITNGSSLNTSLILNQNYVFASVAGNLSILPSDTFSFYDIDTSSSRVITLPLANSVAAGRFYLLKDKTGNAATNNITVNANGGGSDLIDQASSLVMNAAYQMTGFVSDGSSSWQVIRLGGNEPMVGDVGGTSTNNTVNKINGASVPAAGSLTTGNVLQVSGSSAVSYGPVNLAGGANYVSGQLPTANQVSQSMAGDVGGTTAANTVNKINGTSVNSSPASNTVLVATSSSSSVWSKIVDGYVSSSAAIAGSKINPNFGSQALTAGTSALGISTSANTLTGSLAATVRTVTGNLSLDTTTTDLLVLLDSTSTAFTLTLPAPTTGRVIKIMDKTGKLSTNSVTIARYGSETINGVAASKVVSSAFGSWTCISDGTNWIIA